MAGAPQEGRLPARALSSPSEGQALHDPLRVGFVDDHEAARKAIETVLSRHGCVITCSAGTATEGYAEVIRTPPDVTIIDAELPDEPGPALVRRLLNRRPDLRILLYIGRDDIPTLRSVLASGAQGYALKIGGLPELLEALRAVAAGGTYMDPRITSKVAPRGSSVSTSILSERERQVLEMLARGWTGEGAASQLSISAETVRTHIRNAMHKLEARTRVHAVALAIRDGEIELPP